MKTVEQKHLNSDITGEICARYENDPATLIEILHDTQEARGYIPVESLREIAEKLNITRAEVHGVVSFYEDFKTSPPAKVTLKICRGEACQSLGVSALIEELENAAKASSGDLHVEAVYCLGNCALAPAAMIGKDLLARVSAAKLLGEIEKARKCA